MNAHASILLNLTFCGIGPRREFPAEIVLAGDHATLVAYGMAAEKAERLLELRRSGAVPRELAAAAREGVRIVTKSESGYPPDLAGHPYAPPTLYIRGRELPPQPRIAIVGARQCSSGMARFASEIAAACARAGIPVVSGLARGIDAAAHRGALTAKGACVGVLGCGVDVVYPSTARELFSAVRENGCLIATWPIGTPPLPHHFPIRNRLLAALAQAVIVVQARPDSGSMSTARAALDAGIEVLAVPGSPDDPLAVGTNRLIRDGARPILEPRDAVEALLGVGADPSPADRATAESLDPVLLEIGSTARTAEEIAVVLDRPLADVLETLVASELRGEVERLPGGLFRGCRPTH